MTTSVIGTPRRTARRSNKRPKHGHPVSRPFPLAASRRTQVRRSRAFTLLEVLLALAIIGVIASVLVGGAAGLMNDKPKSADEVFWAAVQEARKMALKSEREVALRFVDEKEKGVKAFVVTDGQQSQTLPVSAAGDLEISFLLPQKGGNVIMIAGTVLETTKVEAVTFYPDGTCTAFRVQFYRNGAASIQSIDPWTCAPVLPPNDPNNPVRTS